MRTVIEDLGSDGIRADELEGALNRSRRSLVGQLNSVGDRADAFAHAAVLRNDPDYVNAAFDRYATLTGDDVTAIADEVVRPERLTTVHVVPRADANGAGG